MSLITQPGLIFVQQCLACTTEAWLAPTTVSMQPHTSRLSLLLCRPADVDFALYVLPDSDNDDIQIITDPSVISQYPNLSDEAACTSNCLFKRSKDDILNVATTSPLFSDFTNIVALWGQDSVDTATGAQSVSRWSSSGCWMDQMSSWLALHSCQ